MANYGLVPTKQVCVTGSCDISLG